MPRKMKKKNEILNQMYELIVLFMKTSNLSLF